MTVPTSEVSRTEVLALRCTKSEREGWEVLRTRGGRIRSWSQVIRAALNDAMVERTMDTPPAPSTNGRVKKGGKRK